MPENYAAKVVHDQNGNRIRVRSGGVINIETGGALQVNGTPVDLGNLAAGFAVARGEVLLDGANPTSVATGLATVSAAFACIKLATTPGDDPVLVTVDYAESVAAGQLDIYAWKNNGTDPTLVASTNNTVFVSWIAIGTAD